MRKHLNICLTVMMFILAMAASSLQAFAVEADPLVETITLDENLEWDTKMPADLSWKTAQDKGQWIEDLGIAQDATSLILVINNLDKKDEEAIPGLDQISQKERSKQIAEHNRIQGKSRLTYLSKGRDGEWMEIFAVDCYISGGEQLEKEDIYGAYEPIRTFGVFENPGSLIPYKKLDSYDYWTSDPEHESYGSIYTIEKNYIKQKYAVNLQGLKSYCNYGMILWPEEEYDSCPPLIINCQQNDSNNHLLSGIQMPQENLRMMIQSIDQATRFIIAESIEDLETM